MAREYRTAPRGRRISPAMRPPGSGELLFILFLIVVVFGGSKINPIGDALGAFWRNLKRGMKSDDRIAVRPADEPRDAQK